MDNDRQKPWLAMGLLLLGFVVLSATAVVTVMIPEILDDGEEVDGTEATTEEASEASE
ncbi:MAG: hypothetical protein AAGF12_04085 [Myxococcota bacterium]